MTRSMKIVMRPDPFSDTLQIRIEIPELFTATHFFALQEFEKKFMGYNVSMPDRLRALADFIERTQGEE